LEIVVRNVNPTNQVTNVNTRLPLAALIRNERSGIIYFVIKVDRLEDNEAYYLCHIYDPSQDDQTLPFLYHFIVGDDNAHKYTILNTRIEADKDGSLYHFISYMQYEEAEAFKDNKDFMLRYMTACRFYKNDKHMFSISSVNKEDETVDIKRKSTWLERFLFKPIYLTFRVSWSSLLNSYIPFISEDLDEVAYVQTVQTHRYF
jgi:hypothetical protein